MGEAKRRRKVDPTYGKEKRGLVISCPLEIAGTSLSIRSTELDPEELRFSLLFWDSLIWPTTNALHIGGGPEADFLESVRILSRPTYKFSGQLSDIVLRAQVQAFADGEAKEPGKWALAQGQNSFLIKENKLRADSGLLVELYRAVPVPNKDVPLNEILEFRLKRYDQLYNLRCEVDRFFSKVVSSPDPVAAREEQIKILDKACADAIRVAHEWKFPVRLSNVKASFDLRPSNLATAGAAAYFGSVALGVTESIIAGLLGASGAAASAIKISGDFGWSGLKDRKSPYRYISQYHNELF